MEQKNLKFHHFSPPPTGGQLVSWLHLFFSLVPFLLRLTVEQCFAPILFLLLPTPNCKDKQMDLRSQLFIRHFHWFPALHSHSKITVSWEKDLGWRQKDAWRRNDAGLEDKAAAEVNFNSGGPAPSALAFLVRCPCRKSLSDFRDVGGETCLPQAEGSSRNNFWNSGAWSSL